MPEIVIHGYKCCRCGWEWAPMRNRADRPRICPHCKSPYWDVDRIQNGREAQEQR